MRVARSPVGEAVTVRKPYRGGGVTLPAVAPSSLPPEPDGEHVIVQVRCLHHDFGLDPVWDRLVTRFLPHGWIPQRTASWRELCRMDTTGSPTVLEPRAVAP